MRKILKQHFQRFLSLFLLCVLCVVTILGGRLSAPYAYAESNRALEFDKTNVMDDLTGATINGKPFNLYDYPYDSTGVIKHPEIMNVVEYCYSFYSNARGNYGLYLYFYNPQALNIDTDSNANKVQLAVSWTTDSEGNIVPDEYDKFDLRFCSMSEGASYARLFYKFRVVDHVGADGKTIAERVNSNERRYDISGVELVTEGDANATEYTVGGTYLFTGYAKGYGADETAESNLSCSVRNLETIRLDLSGETDGVDKRTYWRSNSSSAGAHHQNQINSVFFAIDKKVLEKYGYTLQRIKAEWWEYKTRPAIVIDDQRIYNELLKWNGVEISEDYDRTRGWMLYNSDYYYMYPLTRYQWSWNAQIQDNPNNVVTSEDIDTLLPLLFYTGGVDVNDYVLLTETLQNYFETYNKSYVNGHLQFNNKDYSADLFDDSVDEGRTRGYNLREFDISNPDDFWDIHSYDDTHSWWDKLWDYGFGSITTDDSYRDIKPIEMVTPELMAQSDLANTLFINPDDVEPFKDYYNSVKDDCEVFLFRYAVTDYWAEDLSVFEINPNDYGGEHRNGVGELRQGTQFFDFDILEFTFNKEGVYTVIPVVSSPVDHISDYTPSVEPDGVDWWKILLAVLALIVLLIIFMPILLYVIKAVVMSKQKKNEKKPAARKPAAGKKKSEKAKTKKEKIALLERMIAALQNRLKKLKRDNSPARNEFRYNNQTKHPNYVFEEESGKYHSVGITHGEQTFGKKNMPLKQNPKKGDKQSAYVRNGIITDKKNNYSKKPIKNMQFENSDFTNVKSKIRNYKKQRKKAQKKTGSERR